MSDPLESPYGRDELAAASDGFPERGLLCLKCGTRVPQFADLSEADRSRVLGLMRNSQPLLAMVENGNRLLIALGKDLGYPQRPTGRP